MLASHSHCIIESNDLGGNQPTADYAAALGIDRETLRVRISGCLGYLVGEIFTSPSLGTLLLTGGDTLLQCMNCVGVNELEPCASWIAASYWPASPTTLHPPCDHKIRRFRPGNSADQSGRTDC